MNVVPRLRRKSGQTFFRSTPDAQVINRSSTTFAQRTRVTRVTAALALGLTLAFAPLGRVTDAQSSLTDAATSIFRVFLKDGRALPAYGESAVVGDRVIFSLWLAPGAPNAPPKTQLVSLPAATVDVDRTERYARAVRQAYFAATTGEAEYEALTAEVATTIDALKAVPDQAERLRLALGAEQRLRAWVTDHYDYHGAEIIDFIRQLEGVVSQLRAAVGVASISMDLVAGSASAPTEPVLPPPTLREAIEAALSVASVADDAATRQTVLRSAIGALEPAPGAAPGGIDALGDARRRLGQELVVEESYAALAQNLTSRADSYQRAGAEDAVAALLPELERRDAELGRRRPAITRQVADDLTARLEVMRSLHAARDRYLADKPHMLEYERLVRPVLSGLDGMKPVLIAIRDGKPAGFDTTNRSLARLANLAAALPRVTPPKLLTGVHGVIGSVVSLSSEACAKHRQDLIAPSSTVSADASAAAAGALLLLAQARQDLLTQLFPPKAR
jgi:hypothetical protein